MHPPTWDLERMRVVVHEWDAALRRALPAYARLVPEAEARGSVLRPGASEGRIAAAEQRLGVTLPPSYRAFLAISDGADAGLFGADHVLRWYGERRNALCGAERLLPFGERTADFLVPMWIDAMGEFADRQERPSAGAPVQVYDFEPGLRALALTVPIQDGTLALVPFDGEWQVWDFGHSEVTAYQSFAEFLLDRTRRARKEVAQREARVREVPSDETALLLYAEALAELGDPRAVEAACRVAEGRHSERGLVLLIQLGDPRAIPTLRAVYADATASRSKYDRSRRTMALWGLQSCGDPWVVDELQRLVRAEPDARWQTLLDKQAELVRW